MTQPVMTHTLVIDVGSTSIKAALVDPRGVVSPGGERPSPPSHTPPGVHESDPAAFLDAVETLVDAAAQLAALHSIAFSTQMHGVLLTDERDTPLSPFLSWQDERASSVLHRASELPPTTLRNLGMPLRVGLGAFTLAAWLEQNPGIEGGRIHTLGSFLLSRLGGDYVTHLTNAAPLGIVDLTTSAWSPSVVVALGLTRFALPTIVDGVEPIGRMLGSEILLRPDLGDHQAALWGSGLADGDVAISLGTAGIAARIAPGMASNPAVEVRPYFGGDLLHVRSRLPGGRMARQFAEESAGTMTAGAEAAFWWSKSTDPGASGFFDRYTEAYAAAIDELFPGGDRPRRVLLNGGAARHIPWFRERFASSLGLDQVELPDSDLAVRGVADLVAAASPSTPSETRNHHAR